ncbi:MAG: hypothetical protein ACYCPD_08720, partial [Acidobacteriaceae bacterium]
MNCFRKLSLSLGFFIAATLAAFGEGRGATPTPTPTTGVSIAITQPTYGYNVLPGSVRRIYATVTGGTTDAVNWTVDGGATLSSTTGHWVDVTAPASGSRCSIGGTSSAYTVSSATRFTITA